MFQREIWCPVCEGSFLFPRHIVSVYVVCPKCTAKKGRDQATWIWINPGNFNYGNRRLLSEYEDVREAR